MKEQMLFIYFIFIVFSVNSQSIYTLDVKMKGNSGYPLSNKHLYLYKGDVKLSWSFSDEEGKCSFLIDSIPFNSDSVYFILKAVDSLNRNIKMFSNKLNLLEGNEIDNYSIKITNFRMFTQKEHTEYCKEKGLLPRRNVTLGKE